VQGELPEEFARHARFFQHNRKLVRDIEQLEHKTRRQDVLVDEELDLRLLRRADSRIAR
jgi:ATP-dependent helicase HrpA